MNMGKKLVFALVFVFIVIDYDYDENRFEMLEGDGL